MANRLASVLAVLILPLFASAQPLADKVPADAVEYFAWRGAADLGPAYPQSNLKAVMDDCQVPDFVNRFLPEVFDKVGQLSPQAGQIGQVVSIIGKASWNHPTAFFLAHFEVRRNKPPVPHMGIIWQPGADKDALADQLEKLLAQGPAPFPMKVVRQDDVVALLIGYDKPEAALPGHGADALADDPTFKAEMGHLSVKDPVFSAYINIERIVGMVEQFVVAGGNGDPHNKETWQKASDDLGLKGFKSLVISSGFDGKDYGAEAFLDAPAPREGLLKLIEGKPVDDELLSAIPERATMAGAGRFDVAELYDLIHHTVADVDAEDLRDFDGLIDSVKSDSGVDLRKDLLGSLGDQWGYYADPDIGGRGLASLTVVNHLKDPQRFEEALTKLEDYAAKQAEEQAPTPIQVHVTFQTVKVDGMTIHYLAIPLVSPCWLVRDGNLYVAAFPQVAAGAARHVAEHGPSIVQNKAYQQVLDRLGGQKPMMFQFMDLPRTAPDAYGAWLFVSRLPGIADLFGIKSPPMLMPELPKLLSHLSPAGTVGWVDDQGFHSKAIEPFPASTLIASDPAITALYLEPALISALLPSLDRAHEQANRVKSASNLRQMGQAAFLYAQEHKGKFPPDFATMLDEDLVPAVFINPSHSDTATPPADPKAAKEWVNQQTDYIYIGKGKTTTGVTPETVIAHENLNTSPEGVNVLFGDGHVEWMTIPDAQRAIEKSTPAPPDGKL